MFKDRIEKYKSELKIPMKDLTVLSPKRDPYRLDTPAGHAKGRWMQEVYNQVHGSKTDEKIHLRGLHYKLVGMVNKPDGTPYINNDKTWEWMADEVAKCARYLGYLPWDAIRDARNSPPRIFTPEFDAPRWVLKTGEVELYLPENLEPRYEINGNIYRQPYRQIVIAEKQGVESLLLPLCRKRQATLCLPGGELSDQMMYDMLADADEDGRPLVIHQLGDFDPAGWQMAVSSARAVQAMVDSQFPDLKVKVHAPALTLEQCIDWKLPSSPLKETERRGSDWLTAMGREQTELDAAVALAPDEFVKAVDKSLMQYFDAGLADRANREKERLEQQINDQLLQNISDDMLATIRAEAGDRLADLDELVADINDALNIDPDDIDMPTPDAPDVIHGNTKETIKPLFDSEDDWIQSTQKLIDRKAYR